MYKLDMCNAFFSQNMCLRFVFSRAVEAHIKQLLLLSVINERYLIFRHLDDNAQEGMRWSRRTSGCTVIDGTSLQDNYLSWRTARLGGKARYDFDFGSGARLIFAF